MNDVRETTRPRSAAAFRPPSRLQSFGPSQIRENMRIAGAVGAINLAQGRPEFATHPDVTKAAMDAIAAGHNQYSVTWGLEELREAVAAMLARRFGHIADPETEVTITCGVTEGICAAMLALIEPGDEVVVLEPAHENYVPAIRFAGGVPRFVTLRPPDFGLHGDALTAAMSPRTRAIILNTPHNPSGRVFTRDELNVVIESADRAGAYVVTDEIYDHLVYPPHAHIAPATLARSTERIIVTGGLSKIYAATGWRLGYVTASPDVSAAIRTVHDYLTICAPTPFQHAAITALGLPETYYDELRQAFLARRTRLMDILQRTGFVPYEPEGAYYLMADFSQWERDVDAVAFTRMLIEDAGVAVVPGSAFYYGDSALGDRLVRFAFAKRLEEFDAVEERLLRCWSRRPDRRA